MRQVRSMVLSRSAASARRARQLLADVIEAGGPHDGPTPAVAELLVSELATNAIRYGEGEDFRIVVEVDDGEVHVAVHDRSTRAPTVRRVAAQEAGGRGVHLVDTLASSWGWDPTDTGKVVWFRLGAPG